jgi:hypothetical protein
MQARGRHLRPVQQNAKRHLGQAHLFMMPAASAIKLAVLHEWVPRAWRTEVAPVSRGVVLPSIGFVFVGAEHLQAGVAAERGCSEFG